MPEYLAPGVYVEETSFRPKTIEGVSTSTAGFVGPTRSGPVGGTPELLTSFNEFERYYGGLEPLQFSDGERTNFLAHAVRAFFEEGGGRCYVSRVFQGAAGFAQLPASVPPSPLSISARFPGRAGNMRISFIPRLGQNVWHVDPFVDPDAEDITEKQLQGVKPLDTLIVNDSDGDQHVTSAVRDDAGNITLAILQGGGSEAPVAAFSFVATDLRVVFTDASTGDIASRSWDFGDGNTSTAQNPTRTFAVGTFTVELTVTDNAGLTSTATIELEVADGENSEGTSPSDGAVPDGDLAASRIQTVQVLTVDVLIERPIERPLQPDQHFDEGDFLAGYTLHPGDTRSLFHYFSDSPASQRLASSVPFSMVMEEEDPPSDPFTGADVASALFEEDFTATRELFLTGGTDGDAPARGAYGDGLNVLEAIEDISIVAAPGYSFGFLDDTSGQLNIRAIQQHLIAHCERMRYRIAVLDAPDKAGLTDVRAYRGQIDSKYGALYYPWVKIIDPLTSRELNVPPSGHVAGIYARNDVERGVQKAPANEVVRMAVGFERSISKAQQDVLNPEGINCFRFFEGRGNRLWGARTVSSDGEWKYVNLRRYFAYIERSIDKGTQVFVFESNGEQLWENVRQTVSDFLLNEWKSSRLMGSSPDQAFFVRCDRTTMTQNDIDNGRLICLVGVAALRPAEFVIFRVGQKLIEAG